MKKLCLTFFLLFSFLPTFSLAEDYPKVDISGFKKGEYKTLEVSPLVNKFLAISQIGFLPSSSGLPWQERLNLLISAKLSEKLVVSYNIEQEPETPERFDISVDYDNKHKLVFGDITQTFSNNEFASATKSLNGVMIKSKGDRHDLVFIPSSKLRSQIQALTSQRGNNTRGPYSLGHGSIVEGSERIELNGMVLQKSAAYVIDYFEGKITFKDILTDLDEFKYSYEYTNIMDYFFPTLSKRSFLGFQGEVTFTPSDLPLALPLPDRQAGPPDLTRIDTEEVFPNITYSLTEEGEATQEAYRLGNYPAVEFSEQLIFEGKTLVKDEDYRIDYNEGLLQLFKGHHPTNSNPLQAAYRYYSVSNEAEAIGGIGSQGDYFLKRKNIVRGSEKISVDGRLLQKNYEYSIDYDKGSLFFFNKISNTSKINAVYDYKEIDRAQAEARAKETYTKVGMTFLQESAKQGAGLPTAIAEETFVLTAGQNTLYLKNIPFVPTSEGGILTVKKNGADLTPGIDFAVPSVEADSLGQARVTPSAVLAYVNSKDDLSDGYDSGTIKILTTLEATDEVLVTYTYYSKTVFGRYSGFGNGGKRYEIKNFRNIILGSEAVRITNPGGGSIVTCPRNSSPEAIDGGVNGYSINYYNENPPEIIFNEPLPPEKSFAIEFRYVPPAQNTGGNIKQEVLGMDLDLKFGKLLEFNGEMATSNKDKIVSVASTSESFSNFAASTRRLPALAYIPVIENSEKVSVNNYLRNRDIDYTIDCTNGVITFYYITLGTADSVAVEYQYESSGGATQVKSLNTGSAYKYDLKSSVGYFDLAYSKKDVGSSFNPMGGLSLGLGSNIQNFGLTFNPNYHNLLLDYSYRETNDPLTGRTNLFTRYYDRKYSLSINPNQLANIGLSLRRYETLADDSNVNSLQYDLAGVVDPISLSRGVFVFDQKYEIKKTNSDDRKNRSVVKTDFFSLQESLDITKRVKLGYNYQVSEPETLSNYGTTIEAVSSRTHSRSYSYNTDIDLTMGSLYKWTVYSKTAFDEQLVVLPGRSYRDTRNTTYRTELRPYEIFNLLYDFNRQESPSVVAGSMNPRAERTSFSVKLNPHRRLNGGYSHSENSSVYSTGRDDAGRSNSYDFNFIPISTDKLELSNKMSLLYLTSRTPSGNLDSSLEEQSFTQDFALTFRPLSIWSITPGFVQTDYWNIKDSVSLKTQAQSTNVNTILEILNNTIKGDYSLKSTSRINDNVNRHKFVYSLSLSRPVFAWGTLVVSHSFEHNRGEVLSGGTFPDQDYQKKIYDIGLNFRFPTGNINPVLEYINLSGHGKLMDYVNNMSASDNFRAASLSFEGGLNF